MKAKEWLTGRNFTIVLLADAEYEFESFFEGLTEQDQHEVDSVLERMAEHGPILNKEKSRELGDDIYEFKTSGVRIFWFYGRNREVFLSHGKMKNQLTKPRQYRPEIERAKDLRSRVMKEKR